MKHLPVSLSIEGKRVVVVGGGAVATGRVDALVECGSIVTVIAPELSADIARRATAGEVTVLRRAYRDGDLEGASLVMVATNDRRANESACEEARGRGIPVNVADVPALCDFILPSVVRRGDLTIAVSTGGRSPALAVRLRQRIARLIGPEFGRFAELLDEARSRVKARVRDADVRRRIQYSLVDSDLSTLVRYGNDKAIEHRLQELIELALNSATAGDRGIVYIVGSGPGNPGLITVRGLECLRSSDVILHDRLIAESLLDEVSEDAEVIDVGKRAGDQGRMQRFIEDTMIERARSGHVVCRLKGGDPFVFGRGGEEATALTKAGVRFEIIPGVTSAIAAPAAAGIPITHRDVAHSFLVMTGSRAENASSGEWAGASELLGAGGTVIVLMGLAHLEAIVGRLRDTGCEPETPLAVVSRGTQSDQEVRVATLGTIVSSGTLPASPGVIVIGAVVRERDKLLALRAAHSGKGAVRREPE